MCVRNTFALQCFHDENESSKLLFAPLGSHISLCIEETEGERITALPKTTQRFAPEQTFQGLGSLLLN